MENFSLEEQPDLTIIEELRTTETEYILKYNSKTKNSIIEFNVYHTKCSNCGQDLDMNINYCSNCGDNHRMSEYLKTKTFNINNKIKFNNGRYRHSQKTGMKPKIMDVLKKMNIIPTENMNVITTDVFKLYQLINDSIEILQHKLFVTLIHFILFYYLLHTGDDTLLSRFINSCKTFYGKKITPIYFYLNNIIVNNIVCIGTDIKYRSKLVNGFFMYYVNINNESEIYNTDNINRWIDLMFHPRTKQDCDKLTEMFIRLFIKKYMLYPNDKYIDLFHKFLSEMKPYINSERYIYWKTLIE